MTVNCLCRGGCAGTTIYRLFDPATVKHSGSLTLCTACEALLERQPSIREKQYEQQTLRWQQADRTPCAPEPDNFASAIAEVLPAAFSSLARNENGGPTLGYASATLNGGEFGTGAELTCQN
jgi:hypothetical protein